MSQQLGGKSSEGNRTFNFENSQATHYYSETETAAYVNWINTQLRDDADVAHLLPLSGNSLFEACKDGVLLVKLINQSVPGIINEKQVHRKPKNPIHASENLQMVITGAAAIGCQIHNIGAEDIKKGTPHLSLGLIWQIIKVSSRFIICSNFTLLFLNPFTVFFCFFFC
ncbi:calponin homology domain-containing protein [Chytridium lagenaria]|nr:calponin homology domain-containing protein [Chytridium lagenaria]